MCDHIDGLHEGSYMNGDNPFAAVSQQMLLPLL